MSFDWLRFVPETRRNFLDHGVTTIRSAGDAYEWIVEVRQQLRDGLPEGPRLFIASPLFTTPRGHPVVTIFANDPESIEQGARLPGTIDEARVAVRDLALGDSAVDFITIVQERGAPQRDLETIAPNVLGAIVAEAHVHDLPVFAHWGTREDLEEVRFPALAIGWAMQAPVYWGYHRGHRVSLCWPRPIVGG